MIKMIKKEYLRYMTSKFNVLLLFFASIPVIVSYFTTYTEKIEWINQANTNSPDLNLERINELIAGYNGLTYFDNFLFSNDFFIVFTIIVLIGFGVHIGATAYNHLESGYGALLVSKLGYKKYLSNILTAQTMYIVTFLLSFFTLMFAFSIVIGGVNISPSTTTRLLNAYGIKYMVSIVAHIAINIIYITSILMITSMITPYAKNKYLVQIMPLVCYYIPFLIGSTVGNISHFFASLTGYFVADNLLLSILYYYVSSMSLAEFILSVILLPFAMFLIIQIAYDTNIKKYTKDYIK